MLVVRGERVQRPVPAYLQSQHGSTSLRGELPADRGRGSAQMVRSRHDRGTGDSCGRFGRATSDPVRQAGIRGRTLRGVRRRRDARGHRRRKGPAAVRRGMESFFGRSHSGTSPRCRRRQLVGRKPRAPAGIKFMQ